MAGRPAPGPSTGLLVGMGVSVGVALIALVLLVVLWSNQEELRGSADKANREAQRVLSNVDKGTEWGGAWLAVASDRGDSMAKRMDNEILQLARMITSDAPGASSPDLWKAISDQQLQGLWSRINSDNLLDTPGDVADQPLVNGFTALYDAYSNLHTEHEQAQQTITDLNDKVTALTEANQAIQAQFDEHASSLESQVASIGDEWTSFSTQKTEMFDDIERAAEEKATEDQAVQQEQREREELLLGEIKKREAKNLELVAKIKEFQIRPKALTAARKVDGSVLLANPATGRVFVDLGVDDHPVLGLLFAVYSKDTGIPSSGKAKAAVEIIDIGDEVSECRIVWMNPMNPIIKEDIIANPIYDRDRRLTFMVVGAFDLDHDGRDDPNGKQTIESVITDAGGIVTDALTSRADFVIVGARPLVRELGPDAAPEDLVIQKDERRRVEAYQATIEEASSLSIPLLTQETFLNFLARRRS